MGWRRGSRTAIAPKFPADYIDGDETLWWEPNERHGYVPHDGPPEFSTDPAASKQVRAKLAERFKWVELLHYNNEHFTCTVSNRERGAVTELWTATADTEELATCLCAEKAMGGRSQEEK